MAMAKTRVQEAAEHAGIQIGGPPAIVYARLRRMHHESKDQDERRRLKRALDHLDNDPHVVEHRARIHEEHEKQGIPR